MTPPRSRTPPAPPAPDPDDEPTHASSDRRLSPKIGERLLLEAWPEVVDEPPARVLTTSAGRAQLADFVARRHPEAAVACYFLDAYLAELAEQALTPAPQNLTLLCRADLTNGDGDATASAAAPGVDAAALPLSAQGDGELSRDLLQQAYQALRPDGLLLVATDNPGDTWLGEQAAALGGPVVRRAASDGAVYVIRRTAKLKKIRDFRAEFAFRDRGRLFPVMSRPGVFSHRRIDPGARRLIEALDVSDGERVLDIGCGWGAVGLAAAARGGRVEALDSHTRAVECAQANAQRNGLAHQITVRLEAHGRVAEAGTFDLALGNPPYYADFRIARLFIDASYEALRPAGRLVLVTKFPERYWAYFETLSGRFRDVTAEPVKEYVLVRARKR